MPAVEEQQTTVGRYEVVGRLAMGGMAEILLGRLLGPSGFERVVVIKRVLPHLAQEPSFTAMFLDEARIAAAIRHPNVVQVHELGEEAGELYLVMEYLEGESLHGLLRRATMLGERLDPMLVAHVGIQACAGLHAAHELPNEEGRSSGLVHRDISPQNVFIGYDGSVKILDFGIAKAADRITHTEAGTLKGKFSYMSPEQCLGEPLDRRSDLFSLGIVLYEALTGRRLFHRRAQLQTLNAVVNDPFPTPSEEGIEVSPALEAVVMRALERERDRRFPDAAEMRRALAEATMTGAAPALPEEELASTMQRFFADRIEEKAEMLRRVRAGSMVTEVPAAEIDIEVELPTVGAIPGLARAEAKPASPSPRRAWMAGAALLIVVLLVGAGVMWRGTRAAPEVPREVAAPPSQLTPAPPPAPEPEPPVLDRVSLRVESDPTGARVDLDGESVGTTPLALTLDRDDAPVRLEVREGRLRAAQTIVPDRDQQVRVVLVEPEPTPSRRRRRPAASAPPAPEEEGFARFD